MKKLDRAGIILLDPVVVHKVTGKLHSKGLCVNSTSCTNFRLSLRRPHCEYYYWTYYQSKTHITAKYVVDWKKLSDEEITVSC